MTTASITVTERAAERIAQIVCNEPDKKMFRISVEGGMRTRLRRSTFAWFRP